MRAQIGFSVLVCVALPILACRGGEAPPASPLPTSTEGVLFEMMQVAKDEANLLETFWADEDIRNGRARWAILKNRMQAAQRALAKLPEPDKKEKGRLIAKYGPEMDRCRRRVDAVGKRLPLVAKVNEELIEEAVKAGVERPASDKVKGQPEHPVGDQIPAPPSDSKQGKSSSQ